MEENRLNPSYELEQQVVKLKAANSELINKYVANSVCYKWNESLFKFIIIIIFFFPLGIMANLTIKLGWPVIIFFWISSVLSLICDAINAYPLSKETLARTPTHKLRQTLLQYSKRDRISTAIYLPISFAAFIWLAYELLEVCSRVRTDFPAVAIFWFIIVVAVCFVAASLTMTYYSNPKEINGLVAEIEELDISLRQA